MSSVPRPDDKRPPNPHDETMVDGSDVSVRGSSAGSTGLSKRTNWQEGAKAAKTVEEFSDNLLASGLMSAEEVKSFSDSLNPRDAVHDAEAFAALLIKANKLTPYQAQTLRHGHTRGLVLGNYVILEKLGEGGMGMVFKARHRRMKRIVALKVLPPSMTDSEDAVNRFHREVEVAAKLTHPNIAAAHDADQADGIHFLVMEHVDGPNLSTLVKQSGPVSIPAAINIVSQAARGLAHAHAHGVVHRDIKPGNLLIGRDGVVKVLDMGLAQLQANEQNNGDKAELTQSGRIMGTVDYMAPEQALDAKSVDQRADIYSLGCTLYYLLAGRAISPEGTLTQKLLWHQTEGVPSLTSLLPEVPATLDELYLQMVAKSPDGRPATMNEVVARLEPLLTGFSAEQLQIPLTGFESKADPSTGSDHTQTPSRLTRVDRQTQADAGYEEGPARSLAPSAPLPRPAARAGSQLILPLAACLGLLGVAAGVMLFAYFASLDTNRTRQGGAGGASDTAQLVVTSSQPNARVFVNGKEQGQTNGAEPYQLKLSLPPGEYQVRVEKDGFKAFEDKVALRDDTPLTLSAALGAKPAIADVMVEIPGVQVSIDGRPQGVPTGRGPYRLPLTLEPGDYVLRLEADGYEPKEEQLRVKAGEKFEKAVKLTERPYRNLLAFVFKSAHQSVDEPITLIDATGLRYTPRKWSEVPATYRDIAAIDLSKGTFLKEELHVLMRAPTLQSLSFADTRLDDEGAKELAELKSLTRLDLRNTEITEKALARLKNLKQLRELDLGGTKISDVGMESLVGLPLEDLRLSGTAISDRGVETLAAVQTLQTLAVDNTRVTEDGYHSLGKAFAKNPIDKNDLDPELSLARRLLGGGATLRIVPEVSSAAEPKLVQAPEDLPSERFFVTGVHGNGTRFIDDAIARELKGLRHLETLNLDGSAVTDDGLAQLRQLSTLRSVELGYLRVAKASVDSLRQALSDADVSWLGPRDRVAAEWVIKQGGAVRISTSTGKLARQLADLPENRDFRLEEIHLTAKDNLAANDLAVIKDLSDLRLLNLVGSQATQEMLSEITGCSRLHSLAVSGPSITNEALAVIVERFPELERLYLADAAISGEALQQLKKLPALQQLSLAGTNMKDADLEPLRSLSHLTWLSLDGTPVSDGCLALLLPLKSLKVLSLDDTRLGSGQQMMESDMLPAAAKRQGLQITDAGIEDLRAALKSTTIHSRSLSDERLAARWVLEQGGTVVAAVAADDEVKVDKLAALPRQACQVLEISLRNAPRLAPDALAAKLRNCPNLRSLDLLGNPSIEDRHLGGLQKLESLTSLSLAKTGVTDKIFEQLGALPGLRVLDLQGTLVTGSGLVKNPLPALTHLYVGTTDFNDLALKSLKDSVQLELLDLNNCKAISDRGLAELAGLDKLQRLDLSLTRATDASGATLGKFKHLKRLNLNGVPVTDALVLQLAGLEELEDINLARTKVSDAGLTQLSALKSLRRISVYGTSVTDAAAQPFRDKGIEVNKSADAAQRDANGSAGSFGS